MNETIAARNARVSAQSLHVASDAVVANSVAARGDMYFALPPIIEVFIDRFNQENIGAAWARPWTIARQVTLQRVRDNAECVVTYEEIEGGIVAALDRTANWVRSPA